MPTPAGPVLGEAARKPLLRLEGLGKRFDGLVAVHPVDLDIRSGEFVTLLGPSGCGKTTLLRMIAGLEEPSQGRIFVGEREVTRLRPERRPFNMVFQSYALFPHLNVFDNVAYGLRAAGVDEKTAAERVRGALAMVGLQDHGASRIQQLSGGMSQRVALVRAIVNEPQVLLLDEPLAALDLQLRKRMQIELRAIQERIGTTFILVTHDQEEALVMSDRIVLMHAGRIAQVGTPPEVYHRPRSRFVAAFIGETSLLACTVRRDAGDTVEVVLANGRGAAFPRYGGEPLPPGAAGFISLRPQQLMPAPAEQGFFTGTITSVVFTGASTDYVVELDGCGPVRMRATEAAVRERGARLDVDIAPGGGVFVEGE